MKPMFPCRRARRTTLVALLATATLGAVAESATAGPFTQTLVVCPGVGTCTRAPLPSGVPNLANPLTSTAAAVCANAQNTTVIDQAGIFVGLCTNLGDGTVAPVVVGPVDVFASRGAAGCSTFDEVGIGAALGTAYLRSDDC